MIRPNKIYFASPQTNSTETVPVVVLEISYHDENLKSEFRETYCTMVFQELPLAWAGVRAATGLD
jgi:hypothetical protein